MSTGTGKRTARVRTTLSKQTVDALEPADKPWIAWDDRITGFGVRIHPSGTKAFIVNYRAGDGGRKAPNKRVVIGRHGQVSPDQARRKARELLGKVAGGDDPAGERAEARTMPTFGGAFEDYMAVNPHRSGRTDELYRYEANRYLADWLTRPLDAITRRDVKNRFNRITSEHGWSPANRAMSLLRSVYRQPCVDHEGLRNPGRPLACRRRAVPPQDAAQDIGAGGGAQPRGPRRPLVRALHRHAPRGVPDPAVGADRQGHADVPRRGNQDRSAPGTAGHAPARGHSRTTVGGGRRPASQGSRVGVPLSRQGATGHVQDPHHLYGRISKAGGARFWFHGLRNCFITVAERELMLPPSLTKRLVNHARPNDVTEGYAADWTVAQLREPAQRIADRIKALMNDPGTAADAA